MKCVLVLFTVLLAGCASTSEEQYIEWENCLAVAKAEGVVEDSCAPLHEKMLRKAESEMIRERGKPTCPSGYISHCDGFSCGRLPRMERDYDDYQCVSHKQYDEWMRRMGMH